MPRLLVTVKISKGFETWTEMAKSLEDEAGAEGAKIIWAAAVSYPQLRAHATRERGLCDSLRVTK